MFGFLKIHSFNIDEVVVTLVSRRVFAFDASLGSFVFSQSQMLLTHGSFCRCTTLSLRFLICQCPSLKLFLYVQICFGITHHDQIYDCSLPRCTEVLKLLRNSARELPGLTYEVHL